MFLRIVAALLLSAVSSALAEVPNKDIWYFSTGNDLLRICESELMPDIAYCQGYIVGIGEALQLTAAVSICLPARTAERQLRDIVVAKLKERPDTRHLPTLAIISSVLEESFPCND